MHFFHLALASATLAASATSAYARGNHGSSIQHRQRSTISLNHGLFKRQGGDEGFPAGCMQTCQPYIDTGIKCSGLEETGQDTNMSQADILKCACTNEFMAATVACVVCAPETFTDSSGTTPRQLISSAQAQCRALGIDTKVDLSPLDNIGAVSKTPVEEAPAPISTEGPVEEMEKTASDTPAKTSDAAIVASPSSTGAGVAIKAQHVLASIVAAGLGAAYFLF